VVRSTHLLLRATDGRGGNYAEGTTVEGFPAEVWLAVEVLMEDGTRSSNVVKIPLALTDALGLPPVKRLFLPPTEAEMSTAASALTELERRLEEDD
jgi:hypothetical protein